MNAVVALLCGDLQSRTFDDMPLSFRIVFAIQNLTRIIAEYPASTRLIIFFYGQLDSLSAAVLNELPDRHRINIIVIDTNAFTNVSANQLRILEDLPKYKMAFYGMRAYRSLSKQYYSLDEKTGKFFKEEANKLLRWLINYFRV